MTIPSKTDAKLLDVPCDLIAAKLAARLSWLDNAYGKCETYIEGKGRERSVYPVIFTGGNTGRKMLKLLPDNKLGNFCFIDTADSQKISITGGGIQVECPIEIIFWFDYRKIYADDQNRTIENVKFEVLDALRYGVPNVVIELNSMKINEGDFNIYKNYDKLEAIKGYLKRPYGGFSVSTTIIYQELCS